MQAAIAADESSMMTRPATAISMVYLPR